MNILENLNIPKEINSEEFEGIKNKVLESEVYKKLKNLGDTLTEGIAGHTNLGGLIGVDYNAGIENYLSQYLGGLDINKYLGVGGLFGGKLNLNLGFMNTKTMYDVYIDDLLIPISPSSISYKHKNMNITYDLANGGEFSILKEEGLQEISFEIVLPHTRYPFCRYKDNEFKPISFYLDKLKKLKKEKRYFQLIISRIDINKKLFNTNIKVSLEDLEYEENSEEGLDLIVKLNFKEFREVKKQTLEMVNGFDENLRNSAAGNKFIESMNTYNETSKESTPKATVKQPRQEPKKTSTGQVKYKGTPSKTQKSATGNSKVEPPVLYANGIKTTLQQYQKGQWTYQTALNQSNARLQRYYTTGGKDTGKEMVANGFGKDGRDYNR